MNALDAQCARNVGSLDLSDEEIVLGGEELEEFVPC